MKGNNAGSASPREQVYHAKLAARGADTFNNTMNIRQIISKSFFDKRSELGGGRCTWKTLGVLLEIILVELVCASLNPIIEVQKMLQGEHYGCLREYGLQPGLLTRTFI